MNGYTYVYILQSLADSCRHYTSLTDDLHARLKKHNAGEVIHTAKYKPWQLMTAIAFHDRRKAAAFEQYLKSHPGRAFAAKHF